MSSSIGNGSTTNGFYGARDGHLCTLENCALRTSRKASNYGRRFLGCSQFNVGPKCCFFQWVDNKTCKSDREMISMLENELQLANQREMTTREMEERSNRRERETHELYVEVREKLKNVREREIVQGGTCFVRVIFHFCNIVVVFCFSEQ